MNSDERFDWIVLACLALISIGMHLHSRMIEQTADKVIQLDADVSWLKDNTVATEASTP